MFTASHFNEVDVVWFDRELHSGADRDPAPAGRPGEVVSFLLRLYGSEEVLLLPGPAAIRQDPNPGRVGLLLSGRPAGAEVQLLFPPVGKQNKLYSV
jgi:hypothetical protein